MSEQLTTFLCYLSVGVLSFILGIIVQYLFLRRTIQDLLDASNKVMDDAIKLQIENKKLKNLLEEAKKNRETFISHHREDLKNEICRLKVIIEKYRRVVPVTELYKKEIEQWKKEGLKSDEIGKRLGVTGSTIRKKRKAV